MKRLRLSVMFAVMLLCFPRTLYALEPETPSTLLIISELKVRNDTAGLNEFIEIYNPTSESVSLNGFKIQYFNTPTPLSGTAPSEAVIAQGILAASESYVLAKEPTQVPESAQLPFSSLADGGGLIRITDTEGVVHDEIAWSSSAATAVEPIVYVPTSSSSKSIHRAKDDENIPIVNPIDWSLNVPNPVSVVLATLPASDELPEDDVEPLPEQEQEPEEPEVINELPIQDEEVIPDPVPVITLEPLKITELLPNPKSPQTDNEDEFIELFNPNAEPVDLNGYRIQTGINYSYTYTFTDITLPPYEYLIIRSGDSNLSLANTAGKARLLDPGGIIVAETSAYEDAPEGSAWALISATWQWTATPTALAHNILTSPPLVDKPIKAPKVAAAKTTKVKAAAAPKVKAASTKKTSQPKKTTKNPEPVAVAAVAESEVPPPLHPGVLAGVSALAVLYAGYEYRTDLSNRIHQFRSYRAARRAARTASSGR